ncbi:MAG: hypothetical protein IJ320_08780 [Phascolarctobacterium sp.]|nr:hypothetical protein [Phascolarctobacterium sp.]
MALPPQEAYFYFDEPTSNFRELLYNRGLPRDILTYECSPHMTSQTQTVRYTIIDANRPDKFSQTEEVVDKLLCYNCTKENLSRVIDYFHPPIMLAFADEASCLEYLYVLISQSAYGAIVDFDESEVLEILHAYREGTNNDVGIIKCCEIKQIEQIPSNKPVFFSNVVNSFEQAYLLLTTEKLVKVASLFSSKCIGAVIVSPHGKSYSKMFWSE